MSKHSISHHGFTLLEIIVTLVLVGFVSFMAMPFFLSGVTTSNEPADKLAEAIAFRSVMAPMVSEYNESSKNSGALINLFNRVATPSNFGGGYTVEGSASATAHFITVGDLEDSALLLTIRSTNNPGETLTHLFTQD